MRNLRSRVTIVPYLCLLCPGTNMTSCRMQMQNAECRISSKAVNCTRCRMQMQNAECRIGPKARCLAPDAECRMQELIRMRNRAQSCELHPTDKLFGSH